MASVSIDPFAKSRAFVQTGEAVLPELDRWTQITEDEVALVAEMTRRNELSGGTPVVREFEQQWRDWIGSKFAVSVFNGTPALCSAYFGLRAMTVYDGVERAGWYGFPVIHEPDEMGMSTEAFMEAVNARGLTVSLSPYPNLHELPLFAKGFDIFTRNRGPLCASEGYEGYQPGDFPNAERAARRTVFLPRLSDPIPDAAGIVLNVLRQAAAEKG